MGYMLILKIKYSELQVWNCLINLRIIVLQTSRKKYGEHEKLTTFDARGVYVVIAQMPETFRELTSKG